MNDGMKERLIMLCSEARVVLELRHHALAQLMAPK